MSTEPTSPDLPPRRLRKRFFVPAVVLGVLILVVLGLYVRGTWANPVADDPTSSAAGARVQLYLAPDGKKQVRCAEVLDWPPEDVWAVISDHAHADRVLVPRT